MKNGGKNKSVAFILLFSVYISLHKYISKCGTLIILKLLIFVTV